MKKYALVIALLASVSAHAQGTWLDINTTSYHAGGNSQYNSKNFGLGLEKDWGDALVMAGRYSNSLGTPSRYILGGYTPVHIFGGDIGIVAGALDGYTTMRNGHAFFAAGGIAKWSVGKVGIKLLLLPPIKGSVRYDADGGKYTKHATPAAVGFVLQYQF